MEQQQTSVKEMKCTNHKFQALDLINLTGTSQSGRMCFVCMQKNNIPLEQCLSISELFAQREGDLLSTYPPFKNGKIRDIISQYCDENLQIQKINEFFLKLREDIQEAIESAENKAKQQLIKNESVKRELLQELAKISETDNLKQLLVSGGEQLNVFLEEKWKNAESNEHIIQNVLDKNSQTNFKVNFEKKEKEANNWIQSIQQFNLFDEIIAQQQDSNILKSKQFPCFIKSTCGKSSELTIKKNDNSLQLINSTSSGEKSAFLDLVLDPNKKYTIKLNYQPFKQNLSCFTFGIADAQLITSTYGYSHYMSFYNNNESWGIVKYLKGPNITKGQRKGVKEKFEIRIHLQEKILKVASLPNYESIIELDDRNKILSGKQYKFGVMINHIGDIMEITDVIESDQFENNQF